MVIGEETEFVEFKKTTGEKKEALQSICAMLNKHCKGSVYFGINDFGYVEGQQISDSTKKDISRWIYESIYPRITPSIEVQTIDNKKIIKVSFSGHNRPYSVNGEYLIRTGTENRRMSTDELKKLIKRNDYASHWEEEISDKTIDDIDEDALLDFYNSAIYYKRLEMSSFAKEKLLTSLDLVEGNYLKNAAVALFGKDANIGLKLATYATDDKVTFLDLKLINGNIYNLVNLAIKYILDNIKWVVDIGSRKREEKPEIPERAIREIVVNSFAHADYETTPEIEIGIHPSKIEIYNPGSFPDDLTPYDFINKNMSSIKRNKLILDVLFRSKDVEKAGTGFQRVNEICNENGVTWNYRLEAYGFFFEFIRPNVYLNKKISEKLTKQEEIVLNLIASNQKLSKKEIALRINKSDKTIQRIISSLQNKGLIEREGGNRRTYWKLIENYEN
jgi:ATP-dependent DNA helicase RecG